MPSYTIRQSPVKKRASSISTSFHRYATLPTRALTERRNTIDAEVSDLYTRILELNRLRNHTLPVFALPVEIFREIFLYIQAAERAESGSSSGPDSIITGKRPRWLAITEVCYAFRAIALACPQLWTVVDCSRPRWAGLVVQRAQELPLTMLACMPDRPASTLPTEDPILRQLNALAPRARRLVLAGNVSAFCTDHVPALGAPNETLQSLTVRAATYHRPFVAGPDFLGGHAPHLSELRLSHCTFAFDVAAAAAATTTSTALSGITTLDLDFARFGGSPAAQSVSVDEFLDALERMPRLATLGVRGLRLAGQPEATLHEQRRVAQLPHLTHVRVQDAMAVAVALLDHLPRPDEEVVVESNVHFLPEARWLLPRLMAHLGAYPTTAGPSEHDDDEEEDVNGVAAAAATTTTTPRARSSAHRLVLPLHAFSGAIAVTFRAVRETAATAAPVTRVFDITTKAGAELAVVEPFLDGCATLELDYAGRTGRCSRDAALPSALWSHPPLPALRQVVVKHAPKGIVAQNDLAEWLAVRRSIGRPQLESVQFVRCAGFTKPSFEKDLVKDVQWIEA